MKLAAEVEVTETATNETSAESKVEPDVTYDYYVEPVNDEVYKYIVKGLSEMGIAGELTIEEVILDGTPVRAYKLDSEDIAIVVFSNRSFISSEYHETIRILRAPLNEKDVEVWEPPLCKRKSKL